MNTSHDSCAQQTVLYKNKYSFKECFGYLNARVDETGAGPALGHRSVDRMVMWCNDMNEEVQITPNTEKEKSRGLREKI